MTITYNKLVRDRIPEIIHPEKRAQLRFFQMKNT